jgi:NADH:ubiquinone oxidoreductase subunit 6 (subunit J)
MTLGSPADARNGAVGASAAAAALGVVRELNIVHSQTLLMFAFTAASLAYETLLFAGVLATGATCAADSAT